MLDRTLTWDEHPLRNAVFLDVVRFARAAAELRRRADEDDDGEASKQGHCPRCDGMRGLSDAAVMAQVDGAFDNFADGGWMPHSKRWASDRRTGRLQANDQPAHVRAKQFARALEHACDACRRRCECIRWPDAHRDAEAVAQQIVEFTRCLALNIQRRDVKFFHTLPACLGMVCFAIAATYSLEHAPVALFFAYVLAMCSVLSFVLMDGEPRPLHWDALRGLLARWDALTPLPYVETLVQESQGG